MKTMTIGLIIIGDEILSGRRADRHLAKVIALLNARGLQLGWANYIGDEPEQIIATLKRSFATNDTVFSCGGIGATPDDHTRQCAADALGVPLAMHPFARERILERIAKLAQQANKPVDLSAIDNINRLKMGEFPVGAEAIPNPFNNVPGFSVGKHYFFPGFPEMAWPMIEWVLDTHYTDIFHQSGKIEKAVLVYGAMEAVLTPLMEEIEHAFPPVKTFSLPRVPTASRRAFVELGVKGEVEQVKIAFERMLAWLQERNMEFTSIESGNLSEHQSGA